MTSLTNTSETQPMAPAALGIRGQVLVGGQFIRAYTLELEGEMSRSVARAVDVEPLLARQPDQWLSDGIRLVAAREGTPFGDIELIPFFCTPARMN